MGYPSYEEELRSWLEENDLPDNEDTRNMFEDYQTSQAELAYERAVENGVGYTKYTPPDPWKAYLEEMR